MSFQESTDFDQCGQNETKVEEQEIEIEQKELEFQFSGEIRDFQSFRRKFKYRLKNAWREFFFKHLRVFCFFYMLLGMGALVSGISLFKYLQTINKSIQVGQLLLGKAVCLLILNIVKMKSEKVKMNEITFADKFISIILGFVIFLATFAYWFSLQYLNIGSISIIFYSQPIIYMVLARISLRERIDFYEIINLVFGFTAIAAITIVLVKNNQSAVGKVMNIFSLLNNENEITIAALIICFSSMILFSIASILGRKLSNSHYIIVNTYQSIVILIISGILSALQFQKFNVDQKQILIIVLICICGYLYNYCQEFVLAYEFTARVQSLRFFQFIIAYLADHFLFGYQISLFEFSAAIVVILSSVLTLLLQKLNNGSLDNQKQQHIKDYDSAR